MGEIGLAAAEASTIVVGKFGDVNPRLATGATGTIEFVGADIDKRAGVAVIGVFEDDDVFAVSVGTSETQSEFVGFAAGIHEVADTEWSGKKLGEAFGVVENVVVEIAGIGVEQGKLRGSGVSDARVRVTDERNIVVDVEIGTASVVVKKLTPATDNFQRLGIGDAEIFAEERLAGGESLWKIGRGGRK